MDWPDYSTRTLFEDDHQWKSFEDKKARRLISWKLRKIKPSCSTPVQVFKCSIWEVVLVANLFLQLVSPVHLHLRPSSTSAKPAFLLQLWTFGGVNFVFLLYLRIFNGIPLYFTGFRNFTKSPNFAFILFPFPTVAFILLPLHLLLLRIILLLLLIFLLFFLPLLLLFQDRVELVRRGTGQAGTLLRLLKAGWPAEQVRRGDTPPGVERNQFCTLVAYQRCWWSYRQFYVLVIRKFGCSATIY